MFNLLRRNGLLIILCVQVAMTTMGMGLISPILPQYAKVFGVSITMVGLLFTLFGVARLLTDIPAGRLTSKLGCRPVLIAGPIILCLGSIGCGLAVNYWELVAFRFVQGIGSAVLTTAAMIAIMKISTSQNRGQMMGFYQGCFLIGAGIGPAIGGFIAEYMGLRTPFFIYAVLAGLATLWGYLRLPKNLDAMKSESAVMRDSADHAQVTGSTPSKMGFRPLLKDLNFILISTITFNIFFMRNASQSQILPLIGSDRLGLSEGPIGLAMAVIAGVQMITIFTGSHLSDRFGRKIIITISCLVVTLSLVILALSGNYLMFLVSCVIGGIGVGIAGPAPAAYAADIVSRDNYGMGMGLYRAVGDLGMVIGPVLMGWLADNWGYSTSLYFNCIILLITIVIFQAFARETIVSTKIRVKSSN